MKVSILISQVGIISIAIKAVCFILCAQWLQWTCSVRTWADGQLRRLNLGIRPPLCYPSTLTYLFVLMLQNHKEILSQMPQKGQAEQMVDCAGCSCEFSIWTCLRNAPHSHENIKGDAEHKSVNTQLSLACYFQRLAARAFDANILPLLHMSQQVGPCSS